MNIDTPEQACMRLPRVIAKARFLVCEEPYVFEPISMTGSMRAVLWVGWRLILNKRSGPASSSSVVKMHAGAMRSTKLRKGFSTIGAVRFI
jgi:hypothetical protein